MKAALRSALTSGRPSVDGRGATVVTPMCWRNEVLGVVAVCGPSDATRLTAPPDALQALVDGWTQLIRDACETRRADLQRVEIERVGLALRVHLHEQANHRHAVDALLTLGEIEEARRFAYVVLRGHRVLPPGLHNVDDELAVLLTAEHALARRRGVTLSFESIGDARRWGARARTDQWAPLIASLLDDACLRPGGLQPGSVALSLRQEPDTLLVTITPAGDAAHRCDDDVLLDAWSATAADTITIWHSLLRQSAASAGATVTVRSQNDHVVTEVRLGL